MNIQVTEGFLKSVTLMLLPATGKKLPVEVAVDGAEYEYDDMTGMLTLSDPTDEVGIAAEGLTAEERARADLMGLADALNDANESSGSMQIAMMKRIALGLSKKQKAVVEVLSPNSQWAFNRLIIHSAEVAEAETGILQIN